MHDFAITDHVYPSRPDVAVVEPAGEIDAYTAPRLQNHLDEVMDRGTCRVVVDLTRVVFLDSAALGALIHALNRAERDGGAITLVCRDRRIQKIFAVTELTTVFWIVGTVREAAELFDDMAVARRRVSLRGRGVHWWSSRIYLSSPEQHVAAETALVGIIGDLGLQVGHAFAPVRASWFREFLLRFRKAASGAAPMDDVVARLVRATEMQALHRPQAEIDASQGEAVARLVVALGQTPRAVVQVGSILIVKVDEVLVVRNLTQLELAYWERNPSLFRDPEAALNQLQKAVVDDERRDPPPAVSA
ncbi:STAS domain-containing protein [Actinomadura sp. 9N215]|uniref:STAS domain-containing protein n=1 Tax=Actinomadura sp. 9N215 TaxID=3375150 RepID=UPI0037ABB3D7